MKLKWIIIAGLVVGYIWGLMWTNPTGTAPDYLWPWTWLKKQLGDSLARPTATGTAPNRPDERGYCAVCERTDAKPGYFDPYCVTCRRGAIS